MTYIRGGLILVALVVVSACASPAPTPTPTATLPVQSPSIAPASCPSPPPVYHPQRLAIINVCQEYRGIVVAVLQEQDGDHHLWISPDPGYESFLNSMNVLHGVRALVAEIVPACTSEPASSGAAAQCPPSRLPEPVVGDHVSVMGPWVTDTIHGWNEIHPVVEIQELPRSARTVPFPKASEIPSE